MIIDINNKSLKTENDDFWIAPDATVIGDVQMAICTSPITVASGAIQKSSFSVFKLLLLISMIMDY